MESSPTWWSQSGPASGQGDNLCGDDQLRSHCHSLQLAPAIRAELRTAALRATRGPAAQEPPMVYLDQVSDDVADAYTPQVRYWIEADHVRVRIRLLGKQRQERTLDIPGKDPQVLARRITQEIIALLPK